MTLAQPESCATIRSLTSKPQIWIWTRIVFVERSETRKQTSRKGRHGNRFRRNLSTAPASRRRIFLDKWRVKKWSISSASRGKSLGPDMGDIASDMLEIASGNRAAHLGNRIRNRDGRSRQIFEQSRRIGWKSCREIASDILEIALGNRVGRVGHRVWKSYRKIGESRRGIAWKFDMS